MDIIYLLRLGEGQRVEKGDCFEGSFREGVGELITDLMTGLKEGLWGMLLDRNMVCSLDVFPINFIQECQICHNDEVNTDINSY